MTSNLRVMCVKRNKFKYPLMLPVLIKSPARIISVRYTPGCMKDLVLERIHTIQFDKIRCTPSTDIFYE